MKKIPVAAVYDRRNETIPALIERRYRAAVYDRRKQIPADTDSRYMSASLKK